MRTHIVVVGSLVSILAGAVVACSSDKAKPAESPAAYQDGGGVPVDQGMPRVDAGAFLGALDGSAPDAGAPFFTGTVDAGAVAALGEAALDTAIDLALTEAAAKAAPKMIKEGQAGRATLAPSGHFDMAITLMPNRCYTIVAHALPGTVTALDVKLYGPLPLMAEAAKSGAHDKNTPVVGKGTQALCPLLLLPAAYKVDVAATSGSGRIGVQVFARDK
jgi:hypothetical protein